MSPWVIGFLIVIIFILIALILRERKAQIGLDKSKEFLDCSARINDLQVDVEKYTNNLKLLQEKEQAGKWNAETMAEKLKGAIKAKEDSTAELNKLLESKSALINENKKLDEKYKEAVRQLDITKEKIKKINETYLNSKKNVNNVLSVSLYYTNPTPKELDQIRISGILIDKIIAHVLPEINRFMQELNNTNAYNEEKIKNAIGPVFCEPSSLVKFQDILLKIGFGKYDDAFIFYSNIFEGISRQICEYTPTEYKINKIAMINVLNKIHNEIINDPKFISLIKSCSAYATITADKLL